MKKFLMFLYIISLASFFSTLSWSGQVKDVTIGILSVNSKVDMANRWAPLSRYLSDSLEDYNVNIRILNHEEMQEALDRLELDFVLTNPAHFITLAHDYASSGALSTIVKNEEGKAINSFGGVIFTRSELDDVSRLEDIVGKKIACVGTESRIFGGFYLQAYEMFKNGLELPLSEQLVLTGLPQENVVNAVLEKRADIGFVRTGMLEHLARSQGLDLSKIKIINQINHPNFPYISSTRLFPEWAFVALPHAPPELSRRITSLLLGLPLNSKILLDIRLHSFGPPADYQPVEAMMHELRIEPFDGPLGITIADIWENYDWLILLLLILFTVIASLSLLLANALRKTRRAKQEIKKSQRELEKSEEHYRTLVNTIPHGVTVIDNTHQIVSINDTHANWHGHPPEWFVGRKCYDVFKKGSEVCPNCPGLVTLETGAVNRITTDVFLIDGASIKVSLTTALIKLLDGSMGFIEVVEDLTERLRLEADAQRLSRLAALGEMATGVAHEINNPIAGVLGCAELLKKRLNHDSPLHEMVSRILKEGDRIAKIVSSLLSISHPGGRDGEFSVSECIEPVLFLCQGKLEKNGIKVNVKIDSGLPLIFGDKQKIEQVLLNLINNSLYALNQIDREEKEIIVNVKEEKNSKLSHVSISIIDNGPGIQEENIAKVFDPFFTTKAAGYGTGLGLSLCHDIVSTFNGSIDIQSQVNCFTEVVFRIPVLD